MDWKEVAKIIATQINEKYYTATGEMTGIIKRNYPEVHSRIMIATGSKFPGEIFKMCDQMVRKYRILLEQISDRDKKYIQDVGNEETLEIFINSY